jgi:TPR repeat protein
MRLALRSFVVALCLASVVACVDKEAEAKKKAEAQKAMLEAEAKAQEAKAAEEAKKALDDATSGCSAGKPDACVDLGRIQLEGKGTEKSAPKAVESFMKACGLKSKDGCRMAAQNETDGKKKLDALKALCDLGDVEGCMSGAALADELVKAGQLPEPKKMAERDAVILLEKACTAGGAVACTARGITLINDDPTQAVASFTKGCDQGEPTSCWQLSGMFKDGKGMKKKDPKKAAELAKKACDAGLKDACAN